MTRLLRAAVGCFLAGILAGCFQPLRDRSTAPQAQLFDGMGTHHRRVSTDAPNCQRYFDQGLIWAFAFNHDEAIRSFSKAADLDRSCAMTWWGIALCNGPHINNPVVNASHARDAWQAVQQAKSRIGKASPVERALIEAVAKRYSPDPAAPRRPLDEAYAAAMESVHRAFPKDADVATLYAESLMDLQPWDLWTHEGKPKGRTTDILAALEAALALQPDHPGANHLYIHAVEAGPHPELANASADRLRNAVPMSGHLTHMPSHIDVQTGRWSLAADQNRKAIASDRRYRKLSPRQGFYNVYMAHNHQFLSFACMMTGRADEAIREARAMIAAVPQEFIDNSGPMIDPYLVIGYESLLRFGRWDEMLKQPPPSEKLPIMTCFWHYGRTLALAAQGRIVAADAEYHLFRAAVKRVPADALMAINPAHKVLTIADHVAAGEIALARGDHDAAIASLQKAAAIEDDLLYMEPPDWMMPVRHALGAVLLKAGRAAEAEEVYRADLAAWPENGWSLFGLSKSLAAQGKKDEAAIVQARFDKVWADADAPIESSCLCVRGK